MLQPSHPIHCPRFALLGALLLSVGCSSSSGEDPTPPMGLSYPDGATTVRVGFWSPALRPVLESGRADRYSVTPTLPTGLEIDAQTGEISGIPMAAYGTENYVVTAFNSFGDTQAVIALTVEQNFEQTRFAYSAGFTDHTVSMFAVDGATGQLVPNGFVPCDSGPAQLAATPNGDHLYATNMLSGRLTHFEIQQNTGRLTFIEHVDSGPGAVGILIHPTKSVLYTANSAGSALSTDDPQNAAQTTGSSIRVFRIDAATGTPRAIGSPLAAGGPVDLAIRPDGSFLYAANFANNTLGGYSVESDGTLTHMGNLLVGDGPVSVAMHPSGNFLFLTNHRSDELMVFEIAENGIASLLQSIPTADGPIDVLPNAEGDTIWVSQGAAGQVTGYSFDEGSASLSLMTRNAMSGKPFQLALDPLGEHLYVSHLNTGEISTYDSTEAGYQLIDRRHTRGVAGGLAIVSGPTARERTSPVTWATSGLHEVETLAVGEAGLLTDRARPRPAGQDPDVLSMHPHGGALYILGAESGDITTYLVDNETYDIDPIGAPTFVGAGARGLAVDSNGAWAYATVDGGIQEFEIGTDLVPVPGDLFLTGSALDDLVPHPGGRYLYALDREANAVVTLAAHPLTGALSRPDGGTIPLIDGGEPGSLSMHPSGRFLFVTDEANNTLARFEVDPKAGVLSDAGTTNTGVGPDALAVHPSGDLLIVAHADTGNVFAFTLDSLGAPPTLLDALTVGRGPNAVAFEASGRTAYVANGESDSISVLSLGWEPGTRGSFSLDVSAEIPLATGASPRGILAPWTWNEL